MAKLNNRVVTITEIEEHQDPHQEDTTVNIEMEEAGREGTVTVFVLRLRIVFDADVCGSG